MNGETVNGIPNWYNVGYPSSENPLYYGWMHESLLDANLLQSDCAELPVVGSALPSTPVPPTPTPSATPPPNWEYYESIFPLPMVGPNEAHPARLSDCGFGGEGIPSRDMNPLGIAGGNHEVILSAISNVLVVDTDVEPGGEYPLNGGLGNFVSIRIAVSDIHPDIRMRLISVEYNAPWEPLVLRDKDDDGQLDGYIYIGFGHLADGTIPQALLPDRKVYWPQQTTIGYSGKTGCEFASPPCTEHLDVTVFYSSNERLVPDTFDYLAPDGSPFSYSFLAHYTIFDYANQLNDALLINPLALWPSLQEGTTCTYSGS